jgi:YidC/Oxa1 family membrane protein insertase
MLSFTSIEGVAYTLVFSVASALSGLGGAAAAIAVCTVALRLLLLPLTLRAVRGERHRARLAPQVARLRDRHRSDPARLAAELTRLYRTERVSPVAGLGPALLQVPFFFVLYRLFYASQVAGHANALLGQAVFGVPLGARFLVGAGGGAGALVFGGLFVALALLAWWAAWWARRVAVATGAATTGLSGWLIRLAPFTTVLAAAFVPLAAGLYLVTTRAVTAVETTLLHRGMPPTTDS